MNHKYDVEKQRILRRKIELVRELALELIQQAIRASPEELRRGILMPFDRKGSRFFDDSYYVIKENGTPLALLAYSGYNECKQAHEFSLLLEGFAEDTGIIGIGPEDLDSLVITDEQGHALVRLDGKITRDKYHLPCVTSMKSSRKCGHYSRR